MPLKSMLNSGYARVPDARSRLAAVLEVAEEVEPIAASPDHQSPYMLLGSRHPPAENVIVGIPVPESWK